MKNFKPNVLFSALFSTLCLASFPASAASKGETVYNALCASCHGGDLRGARGPDLLDEEWLHGGDRASIAKTIQNGVPDKGMPAFGVVLSGEEINQVVTYIEQAGSTAASANAPEPELPGTLETLDYSVKIEVFAKNLATPWAIDFIDKNTALVTERDGNLRMVKNGKLLEEPIRDTPFISPALRQEKYIQGGLLDVTVDPNHAENGWIYLSYSHVLDHATDDGKNLSMARVVRGRIKNHRWIDEETVFEAPHDTYASTAPYHYGCRVVFDKNGLLYVSVGDRYSREDAQNLGLPNGKIHRVHKDGRIPPSNPFSTNKHALATIYSHGHRNPQGMAMHPDTGDIWAAEHGPKGGDEINVILAGKNYGWPSISYGINYDGTVLTPNRRHKDMQQPVRYYRPSIAVSVRLRQSKRSGRGDGGTASWR